MLPKRTWIVPKSTPWAIGTAPAGTGIHTLTPTPTFREMEFSTVPSDGASIRPSTWDLLRSAFTATSTNVSVMTSIAGVGVTIITLTSITNTDSVAAILGTVMAAISGIAVAVSSRTTMAAISGTVSDTVAPIMGPWPAAEAANTLEAVSMVVAEAFTVVAAEEVPTVVAEEVTTKSRNTGKTKRQGEPAMHSGTRKRPAFLCQGEPGGRKNDVTRTTPCERSAV